MSADHPMLPDTGTLEALSLPERRVEGRLKLTGAARYAADHSMPDMLWAAFLGSPVPHARIRSIDTTRARAMPGVHAVLTGQDAMGIRFGRRLLDRPVLAWDTVLFVGDRIAAVAADSLEAAEAAVAEIVVDLEELPAVLDVETALAADAPVLHPDRAEYAYLDGERPAVAHPNIQGRVAVERGLDGIDAAFAGAARVFEHTFTTPRHHAGYIEPHATLVWFDDADVAHVITTNKTPFPLRKQFMAAFGMPASAIVVDAGFIGGDFGGKGYCIDEFACYLLARETRRPIKAVTRYADELGRTSVRHATTMHLRTAVDADGTLIAHDAQIILDGGAYAAAKPLPHLSIPGAIATLVPYRVPHVRIVAQTIYTNTVPAGHMRTPGEVQAMFAGESQLDEIARALGEDPIAYRRRHAVGGGEVSATGSRFREARGAEILDAAHREMDWERPRPTGRGRGIAFGARHVGGGKMPLRLRAHHDGRLEIITGQPDQGSGGWTVMRRVLAATASVDEARVSVTNVTTADFPFDPGIGGSRVTHLASRAAESLGNDLRDWLDERLPRALPEAPQTATLRDDRYVDPATGAELAAFGDVVGGLITEDEPLVLDTVFDAADAHGHDEGGDYDFVACAVEVEVDRETGAVRVTDALIVADVGTVINPVAHRGQLDGGFAMGYGAALMEEVEVDGGAVTTLSFADLKLPTAGDVPSLRVVELPTTVGPGAYGSKSAGELTNAPVAPAIANAVADAVGVRMTDLPLTAERVLAALRERDAAR